MIPVSLLGETWDLSFSKFRYTSLNQSTSQTNTKQTEILIYYPADEVKRKARLLQLWSITILLAQG